MQASLSQPTLLQAVHSLVSHVRNELFQLRAPLVRTQAVLRAEFSLLEV
jgi:hypothetical protein